MRKGRNGEYTKELWIDRREKSKSLAWSSVLLALGNIKEKVVERPKALGDIRGVLLVLCPYSEQFIYFIVTRRPYCWFFFIGLCATVRAAIRKHSCFKAVMAGIAVIKVQSIVTSQFFIESFRKSLCSIGSIDYACVQGLTPFLRSKYASLPQIFFGSKFLRIGFCIEEKCFHFFNKGRLIFFGQFTASKQGSGLFFYFLCLCNATGAVLLPHICIEEVIV